MSTINPRWPTSAPPGSLRKVEVLRKRAKAFLPLFIPGDAAGFTPLQKGTYIPLGESSEEACQTNYRAFMESVGCT